MCSGLIRNPSRSGFASSIRVAQPQSISTSCGTKGEFSRNMVVSPSATTNRRSRARHRGAQPDIDRESDRGRGKSDSVSIVAPAATIARRASCRPLLLAVRRISTSAARQNIAPPSMFGPTYAFHPVHGRLSEAVPRPCRQAYRATCWLRAIGHPETWRSASWSLPAKRDLR